MTAKKQKRKTAAKAAKQEAFRRELYTGDNLPIMRGLDSESVDLVYLDPPFNTGRGFPLPARGEREGRAMKTAFDDTWKLSDVHLDEHFAMRRDYERAADIINALAAVNGDSWMAYLIYMGARLAEIRRILKPSGSVYYHCDPAMSHGVKLLMDAIFGKANFRNEVIWAYRTGGVSKRWWPRKHDVILCYGKKADKTYHAPQKERIRYDNAFFASGQDDEGYYADVYIRDVWSDIPAVLNLSRERVDYPTQKPLALLDRIIKASCPPEGLVLDPFCGCATTCVAAEMRQQQWMGIDIGGEAVGQLVERMQTNALLGSGHGKFRHVNVIDNPVTMPRREDLKEERIIMRGRRGEEHKRLLYEQQGDKCFGCDREVPMDLMDFDHIIPRSRGGDDIADNLQLLCRSCNTAKGGRSMEYLLGKMAMKRYGEEAAKKLKAVFRAAKSD